MWTKVERGVMGTIWISWRTTTTVVITVLQIQGLISVKTKAVTGVEGQAFSFRCEYEDGQQSNAKYFCRDDDISSKHLIRTDKHNLLVRAGRYSLYDDTKGTFFVVTVDELNSEDSGTYWCGVDVSSNADYISVILLNVSRANPAGQHSYYTTASANSHDLPVDMLHLPLYLTAVMCVVALLGVCMFTLSLLLAVKHRRSRPRPNRESSSDYETMTSAVRAEPELCSCSCPDCADHSDPMPLPPDLSSHLTSKHRDSSVAVGLSEYVDVDVPGHICHYHHLDLSRLECHVYHSLNGNNPSKDEPLGGKEQVIC